MKGLYRYSRLVEPETVSETGCFTRLPVRINLHDDVANEATKQFIADWVEQFNEELEAHTSRSNLCELGNLCSLIFPEAPPERLRVLSYLTELALRHDDISEAMGLEDAVLAHADLGAAVDVVQPQAATAGPESGSKVHKLQKLVARVLLDAIDIDQQKAFKMIDAFRNKWLVTMDDRDPDEFESLDSYLEFRYVNVAAEFVLSMAAFALDVDLTDDMVASVDEVIKSIRKITILTNDYYSWAREYAESQKPGARSCFNAVSLFMKTDGISAEDALQTVKDVITAEEERYIQLKDDIIRDNAQMSLDMRHGIEMIGDFVGGYHYWSTRCPRYHASEEDEKSDNEVSELCANKQSDSTSVASMMSTPPSSPPASVRKGDADTEAQSVQKSHKNSGRNISWYRPNEEVIRMPCDYIRSMPSKGVRDILTNALNDWLRAPDRSVRAIKEAVQLLHDSSLILDDIEDNSPIRRGKPAVHTVFGHSQAIHAANFMSVRATRQIRGLGNDAAIDILLEELENLYLGQSLDLNWKFELQCPTEGEYLNMIDNKTGGMFRLLIRLLQAEAPMRDGPPLSFDHFSTLFGRFFQIRDDYMNLRSSVYATQKGPCEDLDEGKFSYPIVHCLLNSPVHKSHILGIFRQRPTALGADPKPLSPEAKNHILACLEESGSLKATVDYVNELEVDLEAEIERLEKATGEENPLLRLLLKKLSLVDASM